MSAIKLTNHPTLEIEYPKDIINDRLMGPISVEKIITGLYYNVKYYVSKFRQDIDIYSNYNNYQLKVGCQSFNISRLKEISKDLSVSNGVNLVKIISLKTTTFREGYSYSIVGKIKFADETDKYLISDKGKAYSKDKYVAVEINTTVSNLKMSNNRYYINGYDSGVPISKREEMKSYVDYCIDVIDLLNEHYIRNHIPSHKFDIELKAYLDSFK